jgi:DNA polymerase I-like protein with 3'-5' exonuclease and polymerase domains
MKQAMVNADAEGFPLQLQVHDELDLSVGSPTEAQALADVMREAMPAKVPFRVDVECGPSLGELS